MPVTCFDQTCRGSRPGRSSGPAVHVGDQRRPSAANLVSAQRLRHASAAGAISAQWNGAETAAAGRACAVGLGDLDGGVHGRLVPEITTWPPPLSLASFAQRAGGRLGSARRCVSATFRSRRPAAPPSRPPGGNRPLHGLAAQAQQPRRVGDVQRAGGGQRGIFAERVARDIFRRRARGSKPFSLSSARSAARLIAISAGWALAVSVSSASGPSKISFDRHPDKLAAALYFDEGLAHRIYAGSDLYLMPSKAEPCGIGQLIALRYGSVPVVRETGGLKDTILAYDETTGKGNGFSFASYNAHDMLYSLTRALNFYQDQKIWPKIVKAAMAADYSWRRSAAEYVALYQRI